MGLGGGVFKLAAIGVVWLSGLQSELTMPAPSLLSALEAHASAEPWRPALLLAKGGTWKQLSFRDLRDETLRWAGMYRATGARPGGVVLIILEHRIELYPAYLGAMRAGLIPSFLPFPTPKQDPTLYWESHKALLERIRPTCIVSYSKLIELMNLPETEQELHCLDVDNLPSDINLSDIPPLSAVERRDRVALLQHSSGTTGLKKGVALTFGQIRRQVNAYAQAIGFGAEDKVASWLPLYHDMGLITSFLMPLSLGSLVVSIDAFEWLLRPQWLLEVIQTYRCTHCWLPNFALNHLVRTSDADQKFDLSSLRAIISSSEPCKSETFESFISNFADQGLKPAALQACYAMAEAVFCVTQSNARPRVLAVDTTALANHRVIVPAPESQTGGSCFISCGRPIEGIEVRIAREQGWPGRAERDIGNSEQASPDAELSRLAELTYAGEIELRGEFLFNGYYENAEATRKAFADGWYRTGDIGFLYDGELFVCGRAKEMLIVHGRNYFAHDIEEVVSRVSGVKPGRVVAVGVYDVATASEEAVIVAETLLGDANERHELRRAIRKTVFDYLELQVKSVEVVSIGQLVKTTSGKMSRQENATRFAKRLKVTAS